MRAEFYRPDAPETVVAVAKWDGRVDLQIEDPSAAESVARILRPTPVVVDDAAYRSRGTRGEVVVQPGTLEWFRAAVLTRAAEAGLAARLVPGVVEGGWDPAAQYRTFDETMDRLAGGSP